MIAFERFVPADLRSRYATRILGEARRTVLRQTVPAIFVYPFVAAWIGVVTSQVEQAPVLFWIATGVLASTMLARLLLALVARRAFDRDTPALGTYLALGVLSAAVLSAYVGYVSVTAEDSAARHAGPAVMFALGGALVALTSIHRVLAIAWVGASLVPMALVCVLVGDGGQRGLMLLVIPYLAASARMVGALHRTYWSSHLNAARLDAQIAEASRLSRLAGMAEIAVNVLHDVGNVLNSVATSTGALERETKPRERSLRELAQMLDVPRSELVAFARDDPRAAVVGPFLHELADADEERDERLRAEVGRLRNRVVHLTQVVSRQQEHARGSGVCTDVEVDGLLEHAVDLVADSFSQHGVVVERPETTGAEVRVDRHQVLQILVNMLRNARDAVEGRRTAKIVAKVALEPKLVHVAIIDEGCGFDDATARRIFQHGFTTKPHGHGFGLHHSIMLARAMGGELSAHSPGPDRGATFTLTLPRAA